MAEPSALDRTIAALEPRPRDFAPIFRLFRWCGSPALIGDFHSAQTRRVLSPDRWIARSTQAKCVPSRSRVHQLSGRLGRSRIRLIAASGSLRMKNKFPCHRVHCGVARRWQHDRLRRPRNCVRWLLDRRFNCVVGGSFGLQSDREDRRRASLVRRASARRFSTRSWRKSGGREVASRRSRKN